MYQNYGSSTNPVEEHFGKQEKIRKGNGLLGILAGMFIGFGIAFYLFVKYPDIFQPEDNNEMFDKKD